MITKGEKEIKGNAGDVKTLEKKYVADKRKQKINNYI